jgi:nitrite reductase (NADH) large subunit
MDIASLDDDAVICTCYGVTKGQIIEAIAANQVTSVMDLVGCSDAGNGCTSCWPELLALLEHYAQP